MENDREDLSEVEEFRARIVEAHGDGAHVPYLTGIYEQLGAATYAEKIGAHETALIDLCRKHRRISLWPMPDGNIIVLAAPKNPKVAHNLINATKDDKLDHAVELEKYALNCVVYPVTAEGKPDRATVKRYLTELPFLGGKMAARAIELAGGEITELGKA
jgi:hypothetical protein